MATKKGTTVTSTRKAPAKKPVKSRAIGAQRQATEPAKAANTTAPTPGKIVDYKILSATTDTGGKYSLSSQVIGHLGLGYEPLGAPFIAEGLSSPYRQAMIKREG